MPVRWPNRYPAGDSGGVIRPQIGEFWFDHATANALVHINFTSSASTRFVHIDGAIVTSNPAFMTKAGRWDVFTSWDLVTSVNIAGNHFSRLAMNNSLVPSVSCSGGTLEYIYVSGAKSLASLNAHGNHLSAQAIDLILWDIVGNETEDGTLVLDDNDGGLTPPDSDAIAILVSRGWDVVTD